MSLTLNDFRNVLGKVNDGDVVFKQVDGQNDVSAIEKANHGSAIGKLFHSYRTAPSDPATNQAIRRAFMAAIEGSREGQVASQATLDAIRTTLGLEANQEVLDRPLSRRDVKELIERLDGDVTCAKLARADFQALQAVGVLDAELQREVSRLMDSPKMMRAAFFKDALPHGYLGMSSDAAAKFVTNNFRLIRSNVASELYLLARERRLKEPQFALTESSVRTMVRVVVRDIQQCYAQGAPAASRATRLPTAPAQPQVLNEDLRARFDAPPGEEGGEQKALPKLKAVLTKLFGDFSDRPVATLSYLDLAAKGLSARLVDDFTRLLVRLDQENHHDLEAVDRLASASVRDLLGVDLAELEAYDADDLTLLRDKMLAALIHSGVDTAHMEPSQLLNRVSGMVRRTLSRVSVETLIANRVAKVFAEAPQDVKERAPADIRARLANAPQQTRDLVAAYRKKAFAAMVKNEPLPSDADPSALDELVRASELTLNETEETRRARFVEIGKMANFEFSMEYSKNAEENAELNGMLMTLLVKHGTVPLFKAGLLMSAVRSFPAELKTDEERQKIIATIRQMASEVTTTEARQTHLYVKCGAARADWSLANEFSNSWTDKPKGYRPLLESFREGLVDFAKMNEVSCRRFLPIFYSSYAVRYVDVMANPEVIPLSHEAADAETLRVVYPEVRAAEHKLGNNHILEAAVPDPNGDRPFQHLFDHHFTVSCGFGTDDFSKIMKLLKSCNINPLELDQPETYRQFLVLQQLARANGFHLDGLKEWGERVFGKPFAQIHMVDIAAVLRKQNDQDAVVTDSMDTYNSFFSASKIKVADFLRGKTTLAEAGFSQEDLVNLRTGLLDVLGPAAAGRVRVLGNEVSFGLDANGLLTGVFDKMPFAYPHAPGELLAAVENAIAEKAKAFPAETVKALLPAVANGEPVGMPVSRARELSVKVLVAMLDNPPQTVVQPVAFSALSTADLIARAKAALDGTFTAANLPKKPPTSYNSAEVIELHRKLVSADPVSLAKVKLPEKAAPISIDKRQADLPTEQTVHDFVADIVLNQDTWSFDAAAAEPGARIKAVLKDYAPEFRHIVAHPDLLDSLPEAVRADVKAIFTGLADAVEHVDTLGPDRLGALETQVQNLITNAMTTLQGQVTKLFDAQVEANADDRALWQHTFAEITGTGGIDPTTENGKFVCNVLKSYFTGADMIEKRAMLSAFIRHTNKDSSPGRLVAELLKGAGPLLQKMLQGLPIASFGPETQIALKDMKSKLAPIPDDVVKAKLLELVRTSNGEILSIEVKKSLGAATVGQALLCTMRTKDHPVRGEEVVVKLLRPNVENAIQREFIRLKAIAAEQSPAMAKSFEEQYASILKELDFTLESSNVDIARSAYEAPLDVDGQAQIQVRSMARSEVVAPSRGAMVLAKVEGDTFGGYIERQTQNLRKTLGDLYVEVAQAPNGPKKGMVQLQKPTQVEEIRQQINEVRQQAKSRREKLERVIEVWVDQALFASGFLNADMHADNAMVNDEFATVIDFGNAFRLTPEQRDRLCVLMLSCLTGDANLFMDRLGDLLPPEAKAGLEAKRAEIKPDLDLMLTKGTSKDVAKRLLAGMAVLQKHGVPVPASVNGFAASLTRLEGALAQYDDHLHGLDGLIRTIQFSPECIDTLTNPEEPIKKALPIFAKFDECLMLFSGTQPMAFDELDEKSKELLAEVVGPNRGVVPDKAAEDFFASDELKAVFAQPDHGIAFLEAFLEKYGQHRIYQPQLDRSVLQFETASFLKTLTSYRAHLAKMPAAESPEYAAWAARCDVLQQGLAEDMLRIPFNAVITAKSSLQEYGPLPAQITFDSIVYTTVKTRLERLGPLGLMKFAGLGVTREMGGEVLGLEDEMREYDNRVAAAVRTADAEANLLKVEDEISSDQRRKLARGAEDFCLPKEGLPTADALKTAEGRAKLLEILGFNLRHLGEKLGSEALTTHEVKYYATVLKGVLDEKLPRLDEATRNAFLLEIGEDANLRTFFDRLLAA